MGKIPAKITKHLDSNKIKYEIIEHKKVYTAYDASATMRIDLDKIVKWLLVKIDKDYGLALVGANQNIDLKKLAKLAGVKKAGLPKENVMKTKFKVKPGEMTAFGSIYSTPVFLDKKLSGQKEAIFSAGSFTESLKIKMKDFVKMEEPTIGQIGVAKKVKPPASLLKIKKAVKKIVKKRVIRKKKK
jgi:Ala-tRNA(Pro) deacylase